MKYQIQVVSFAPDIPNDELLSVLKCCLAMTLILKYTVSNAVDVITIACHFMLYYYLGSYFVTNMSFALGSELHCI